MRIETGMKICVNAFVVLFLALASSAATSDHLKIVVESTTGEQSKDGNSLTTKITVEGVAVTWEQSAGGSRARGKAVPERKRFKLAPAERENLLKLVREGGLLATESLRLPQRPPVFYFALRVQTSMGNEKGAIEISGPRAAVEIQEKKLYRSSLTLVNELYRIMNTHDKSIVFEELVRERS